MWIYVLQSNHFLTDSSVEIADSKITLSQFCALVLDEVCL